MKFDVLRRKNIGFGRSRSLGIMDFGPGTAVPGDLGRQVGSGTAVSGTLGRQVSTGTGGWGEYRRFI